MLFLLNFYLCIRKKCTMARNSHNYSPTWMLPRGKAKRAVDNLQRKDMTLLAMCQFLAWLESRQYTCSLRITRASLDIRARCVGNKSTLCLIFRQWKFPWFCGRKCPKNAHKRAFLLREDVKTANVWGELLVCLFSVIDYVINIYECYFVFSDFFSSGEEKCHRDDFKRFWSKCLKSHCKQICVIACKLTGWFASESA